MSDETKARAWPFEAWLRLAVLQMHLSPKEFWAMDVRDWFTLCRPSPSIRLTRENFDNLSAQFPDEESGNDT